MRVLRRYLFILISLLSTMSWAGQKALQRPVAASFGNLYVEHNGRICPMSTLANDVCVTLFGKASYTAEDGTCYTPEQVITGYLFFYDDWISVPLKHSRKEARNEERQMVRRMVADGSLFRIWPVEGDTWADINQGGMTALDSADWKFRTYVLQYVAYDLAQGRNIEANETIKKLRIYQEKTASCKLPSASEFSVEQCFTRIHYTKPLAIFTAVIGLLLVFFNIFLSIRGRQFPSLLLVALRYLVVIEWIFLTAMLALRWYVCRHIPLSSGHEVMQVLAWFALLVTWVMELYASHKANIRTILPQGILVAGMTLLVSMMASSRPELEGLMPALQSPFLAWHVSIIMLAYALFTMVMLTGIMALFFQDSMRVKTCDECHHMLCVAVALLGIGILLGAFWAKQAWGCYWQWDPKETWALITWIIYLVPVLFYKLMRRHHIVYFVYIIMAFGSVLITYFGVNFFMGGLHSYA